MRHAKRHFLISIALSMLLSLCLSIYFATRAGRPSVRCEVRAHQNTTFSLFTNRGAGYSAKNVEHIRLPGHPLRQYVKFNIKFPFVKDFRLDFESDADAVELANCRCILDEYGLDADNPPDMTVLPLHDVNIRQGEEKGYDEITRTGIDPQVRLVPNFLRAYLKKTAFRFILYLVFLYPLCFAAVSLLFRVLGNTPGRIGKPHWAALVISVAFWALAPLAHRAAASRHVFVDVRQAQETVRLPIPAGGAPVSLRGADGLEIAARLFQGNPDQPARGGILLLHGNYPQAQDFPLYSLMAQGLADRGFRVLTMDFAGFGRSQTPFASAAPLPFDLESETEAALAYLKSLAPNERKLSVIGHSLGANPALRVGLRDPDVRSIALIGPPRRVWERFRYLDDINFFWQWSLAVRVCRYGQAQPPPWYAAERLQAYFLDHDMEHSLAELRTWRHKPVHFLDGDREDAEDLVFLRDYAAMVGAPSEYVTIRGADHNLNVQSANYAAFVQGFITASAKGGAEVPGADAVASSDVIRYDPPTLQAAVDILAGWCDRDDGWSAGAKAWFRNVLLLLFPFR